ncbi:MAG TPA: Hpt domain-containing protein [Pseudolabrys sp.]|nr:Hpt domain-containing protein [Pseudolabrys sp.]
MAPIAVKVLESDPVPAPPAQTAFDRAHLSRMTFGDGALERELLQLFDRQAVLLLERMRSGGSGAVAALAHTLKGSAAGLGAIGVAEAAAAVERAVQPDARRAAIAKLAQAVAQARAAIADMLAG